MRKTLYFMTLFALVAVAAMSVFFNTTGTVSAQSGATVSRGRQATIEMLGRALDFRTGSDIAVFANKGISDNGSSRITGNVAAVEGANVKGLNRGNVQGSMLRREEGFDTNQAQMDLSSSFSILRNLPATLVADSNLSGKTFKAGVYSLASARLDGDMVLDANNDPNSIFVFKVSSALSTGRGSRVVLANGAYAANVFFIVEDTATVSEGTDFNGSIFAGNNVTVNSAKVTGRAVSVNGTVSLNAAEVVQQTGFLEICKAVDARFDPTTQATANTATGTTALIGRVFSFQIPGATVGGTPRTVQVVAGALGGPLQCSAPFQVPSGPITVTEFNTSTNTAGGVTRTGGFVITSVTGGIQSPNVVTSTNLPAGTAVVNVGAAATTAGETVITVVNRAAITGIIEICKVAAAGDTDANSTGVGGAQGTIFDFIIGVRGPNGQVMLDARGNLIGGVVDANGEPVVFQAPLGTIARPGCTGPLTITLPANTVGGTVTTLTIAELPEPGFLFVNATAAGNGGAVVGNPQVITTGDFAGGGIFDVNINNQATTANQTLVTVTNRTIPGQIKICKVAGPGVTQGTVFNFLVTGTPVDPATGNAITVGTGAGGGAVGVVGTGANGNGFATGSITELVQVQAGPVGSPFCTFSQNRFASGSSVNINEVLTEAQLLAGIRLGRIDVTAAFGTAATTTFATNGVNGGTGSNLTAAQITAIANAFGGTTGFGSVANIQATLVGTTFTNAQITAIGSALVGNAAFPGPALTAQQISALVTAGTLTNAQLDAIANVLGGTTAFTGPGLNAAQISALVAANLLTNAQLTAIGNLVGNAAFTGTGLTSAQIRVLVSSGNLTNAQITAIGNVLVGNAAFPGLNAVAISALVNNGTLTNAQLTAISIALVGNAAFNGTTLTSAQLIVLVRTGTLTNAQITAIGNALVGNAAFNGTTLIPAQIRVLVAANILTNAQVTAIGNALVGNAAFPGPGLTAAQISALVTAGTLTNAQITAIANALGGTTGFGTAAQITVLLTTTAQGVNVTGTTQGVTVTARTQIVVATFTNFGFAPAALKICKVAGAGVAVGTPFTFTVTGDTLGGILQTNSQQVTVQAGPASQGGFCTQVGGPFADPVAGGFGSFNIGSNITITETGVSGITATSITSTTGVTTGTTINLGTGTIRTPIAGNVGDIVEVTFVNTATPTFVTPVASTRFDFDGDLKADVSVFRPSNGAWYMQNSSTGFRGVQFGQAGDKLVAADYDGDGKSDIAVYRPSNSTWYLNRSTAGFAAVQFGAAGDIATPADFDRDGKAELAVYRPSSGMWITLSLATNAVNYVPFGAGNDIPVAADYDGDGKADYAVYRPSNGVWYMLQSTKGFGAIQFGNATDKPVVADYDGDGRADQAVYRSDKATGTSTWYVMGSKVGLLVNQFGLDTDSPVPADYDGDGKTDFGVYRASTGYWYATKSGSPLSSSGSALMIIKFGDPTDTPVPMP